MSAPQLFHVSRTCSAAGSSSAAGSPAAALGSAAAESSSADGSSPAARTSSTARSSAAAGITLAIWLISAAPAPARADADLHDRIARIDHEIETDSTDAKLYWRRAELHRLHADSALAAADFVRAYELDPGLHEVWLGRSRLALDFGQPEEALGHVRSYLERRPGSSEGRELAARILDRLGRHQEAAAEMWNAIAVTRNPRPEHYQACALYYEQAGALLDAMRVLDFGADRLAPVPLLELQAAEIAARSGKTQDALKRLDHLQSSGVRKDRLLRLRGEILARAGQPLAAMTAWTDAIDHIRALPPATRSRPATIDELAQLEEMIQEAAARLARGN